MKKSIHILIGLTLTILGLSFYACQEDEYVAENKHSATLAEKTEARGDNDVLSCHVTTTAVGQVDSLINVSAVEGNYPRARIQHLTVSGPINSEDINRMCDFEYLDSLILTDAKLNEIPSRAFYNFKSKAHVILPNSLKKISDNAFYDIWYGSANVVSVFVPDSVTDIGTRAFMRCSSLQTVRLPKNLDEIKDETFYGCSGLKKVEMPEKINRIGKSVFYDCSSLEEITLSSQISAMGESIFRNCSSLKSVVWPQYHYEIPAYTFSGCSNLKFEIPKNIDTIGNYAFSDCKNITEYKISENVKSIGTGAFNGAGITSLVITSETLLSGSLFSYCPITELTIKEGVTSLPSSIFEGCGHLESVELPSSLTQLGADAFNGCNKLENVVLGGVKTIGSNAFRETAIKTINLPSTLTSIGYLAFYKTPITKIKFPSNLKKIDYQTFDQCTELTEVEFNEGLETIGQAAFRNTGIKKLVTPSTLKTLDGEAFSDVTALQSITLNEGLTLIGNYCFRNTNIQTITLPSTVATCGYCLFDGCGRLTSIYWKSAVEAPDLYTDDSNRNILLYVPNGKSSDQNPNQIVNGKSQKSIQLKYDGTFHCPESFVTDISYSRTFNYRNDNTYYDSYAFQNKIGEASCWQTIVLPFEVTSIKCGDKELVPFGAEKEGAYPFWLRELTSDGFVRATKIEANKPYIIAMPNNEAYDDVYNIKGVVTFSADNVTIPVTEELKEAKGTAFNFYPTYSYWYKDAEKLVLNRVNIYDGHHYGSVFVSSTYDCPPFQAYINSPADGRSIVSIETSLSSRKSKKIGPIPQEDDM